MTIATVKKRIGLTVIALTVGLESRAEATHAATTGPVKEIEEGHFGWEVNKTHKSPICTQKEMESEHVECQPGSQSGEPGGFSNSRSVAGAGAGSNDIYVADEANHRIQELEPDGTFVSMFGTDVNKKGGDVCTKAEEGECKVGVRGSAPGELWEPQSVAVDPLNGNVYVAETVSGGGERVQEFTAGGALVLEIGREVNETKDKEAGATPAERDVCIASEKCLAPAPGPSTDPGAFNFGTGQGELLAVDGKHILYIGDEHRVQEFNGETNTMTEAIPLAGATGAIAADSAGDLFVTEESSTSTPTDSIREFDPLGKESAEFKLEGEVVSLAVNLFGRLAVSEQTKAGVRGSLYEILIEGGKSSLHLSTQFASHLARDLAFNSQNEMFAAFPFETSLDPAKHEIISYRPVSVGELRATQAVCARGAEQASDIAFECELNGEVDPWGVSETEVWDQWGRTPQLGQETQPLVKVPSTKSEGEEEPLVDVSAHVSGLRPDETYFYRLVGRDRNVKAPELLSSATTHFPTEPVPPKIVGEAVVAFVKAVSADLFGELNPENTTTTYSFQYAPEEKCASLSSACEGMQETPRQVSPAYGRIGATQEIVGLRPSTTYRYRLNAFNEHNETATNETGGSALSESTFTTEHAPAVEATTEPASAVGTTSAVLAGSVNPDGQASTYAFELGVDNGANTDYATVLWGATGESTTPVREELLATGLQPGTTYAYRIAIHYGHGGGAASVAVGQAESVTTLGLSEALAVPPIAQQLVVPATAFPTSQAKGQVKCRQGYRLVKKKCSKIVKRKRNSRKKAKRASHTRGHKPGQ